MSSIFGHSLAGLTVSLIRQPDPILKPFYRRWLWSCWLMVVAIAPDFDYLSSALHPNTHNGLRITHSIFYACLLPSVTVIAFIIFKQKTAKFSRQDLVQLALPLYLVGFSHLILDLLVGVTAIPLAWPFNYTVFKLPFGLLPSAGKPDLSNYYFYFNLAIEMGVLLPLSSILLILNTQQKTWWKWGIIGLLLVISSYFMHQASGLSR